MGKQKGTGPYKHQAYKDDYTSDVCKGCTKTS